MGILRNIGGSILPANCPEILLPVPYNGGELQLRVLVDEDTHVLVFVRNGEEQELARHPNGYSCHALGKRLVAGDLERAFDQIEYILACGGWACKLEDLRGGLIQVPDA